MFYSQTFLARKGPLGTVWCAAHLQHRLNKSHYTATDISSTVERIMFPEVPIALRMSGHLLLGVVRIYSKKVDYLLHDCNIILVGFTKVFAPVQVNLPENATKAPIQAITLPQTFDLDAVELDDMLTERGSDNHISSQEDITLADQVPTGFDPYVAITFDDDIMIDASRPEAPMALNENLDEAPQERHVGFGDPGQQHQVEVASSSAAFQDPGPSNQTQVLESISNDSSLDVSEIERRRSASPARDTEKTTPVGLDHRTDPTEVTPSDQGLNDKETHTPSSNMLTSGVPSRPFQEHSEPPTSAPSRGPPEAAFAGASPQLAIQPSPPVPQPRQRRVTRRRFFDEKLVLSNRLMKRALEDCSDIVQKRRKLSCSALGVWKLNNRPRMEQVLNEPSLTGLSADISDMFKREYLTAKPHLMVPEEVVREPTAPQFTTPTTAGERLRHTQSNASDDISHGSGSDHAGSMQYSPLRRDDSPSLATSTPRIAAQIGTLGSDFDRPSTLLEEQSCLQEFSATPRLGTLDADLYFLEEDANTPGGKLKSPASRGVDSLSVRTRAVAKYLKRHSLETPSAENPNGDISLNNILEGKTRKICARLFFETLVLKSYGLVDVQQQQPYGDITLKLTPTLSKAEI